MKRIGLFQQRFFFFFFFFFCFFFFVFLFVCFVLFSFCCFVVLGVFVFSLFVFLSLFVWGWLVVLVSFYLIPVVFGFQQDLGFILTDFFFFLPLFPLSPQPNPHHTPPPSSSLLLFSLPLSSNLFLIITQSVQSYVEENGLLFMETSAKTAQNVNELFVEIGFFFLLSFPPFFFTFFFSLLFFPFLLF